MNYSSLFLNSESIENVFKPKQQQSTGRGFAYLAKSRDRKEITEKCEKCDYETTIIDYMYKHNRIKHSDIKHKCTECNYTHAFPTKVRTHHKQVHLGVPRGRTEPKCRKDICEDVGKSDCKDLQHFLIYCGQCEYSTKRTDGLTTHTKKVHEGLIESFPCDQCNFNTSRKASLQRHISGKHIEESVQKKYTCEYEGCTYKTKQKYALRTHIDTKHEGIVRFRCEFMNCNFGLTLTQHWPR